VGNSQGIDENIRLRILVIYASIQMWEREECAKSPCLSLTLEETKTINKSEDFCNYFAQKILDFFFFLNNLALPLKAKKARFCYCYYNKYTYAHYYI